MKTRILMRRPRLPGTTVDTMVRTPPSNPTRANGQSWRQSYPWVGGAKLDGVGSAGMQLDAWGCSLTAKKSWFMFDREIICLGAGIASSDGRVIETVVENRRLTSTGTNAFVVNGSVMPVNLGWSATVTNMTWAHLSGGPANAGIGHYFPTTNSVRALREARTGSWRDVNAGGSTNPITRNYLTLWFDHGTSPSGASYAYVLLPCFTASNVADYAAAPDAVVLENSTAAQAVRIKSTGHTAINFWDAGTHSVVGIAANRPCSVITRTDGTWLDVAVADPTQTNTAAITVEIAAAASGVRSLDTVIHWSQGLTLAASASAVGGSVTNVSFFDGATELGRVAVPPYTLAATNLAPGARWLTAVATEEAGAAATSMPVVVTVGGAPLAGPGQALTLRNVPTAAGSTALPRPTRTSSSTWATATGSARTRRSTCSARTGRRTCGCSTSSVKVRRAVTG